MPLCEEGDAISRNKSGSLQDKTPQCQETGARQLRERGTKSSTRHTDHTGVGCKLADGGGVCARRSFVMRWKLALEKMWGNFKNERTKCPEFPFDEMEC